MFLVIVKVSVNGTGLFKCKTVQCGVTVEIRPKLQVMIIKKGKKDQTEGVP